MNELISGVSRKPTSKFSAVLPKVNTFSRTNLSKHEKDEDSDSENNNNGEVKKRKMALLQSPIDPSKVTSLKQAFSV